MKKTGIVALCSCAVLFALLFSACGKTPSSSGGQGNSVLAQDASDPLPALSAPESPAASASAASAQEPAESAPPQIALSTSPSFVSLPVTEAGGAEGEKALVVLHVPEGWSFDQYTTFSRGEIKIAEFPRLWRAPEEGPPFSTEMMAPYQSDGMSPEDAVTADDLELDGSRLRVLHLKTWMAGSDDIWYLHCAFYAADGYVVEVHLYTVQAWGDTDSEELLAALRTLEVHTGGENAGA
ncbi:MAG: hypothetical protein HDT27_06160 [Subdoligranulum sp.]|nr:hypothetical protein [Subdoligranulum sp.]